MSRYQSSTARLVPTALQVDAIRSVWSASPTTLCSSAALSRLSTALTAPSTGLARHDTSLRVAADLLGDARVATLAHSAGPQVSARLDAVRVQLGSGVAALRAPDAAALLADLIPTMARAERDVVAALAIDTLDGEGYTVIHESGPDADGIEARKGDEVMLVAVTDAGELSIDHVGTDGACADRQKRFEAGMAARGVQMDQRAVTPHGDDDGPLVAAATGREPSLARAVARHTKARAATAATGRRAVPAAPIQAVVGDSA